MLRLILIKQHGGIAVLKLLNYLSILIQGMVSDWQKILDFVSGLIFDYFLVYDLPNDFGLVSIWKGLFTYAAKGGNVLMPMEFLVGLREQKTSTILSSWARKVLRSSKSSSGEYGRFWIKTIGDF